MKIIQAFFILLFIFIITQPAPGMVFNDNEKLFTIEDFYTQILEHHPVARQASLLSEQAKQELRVARGMMDPSINSRVYKKELDGKNYFTLWDNTLKIPVWYGTDIKAGFERNSGINVNGENYTPESGLSYIGISVPIGQGLIIDQRRSTIRQAQLLGNLADAEKISVINKLLLQATKDYWDWHYAYNKLKLHQESFDLAKFRLEAVKMRALEGDLSGIDTVEAKMEMQNRRVMLSQSKVEYQNASLVVSNYLWKDDNTPLEISDEVIPASASTEDNFIDQGDLEKLVAAAKQNHPGLIKLHVKKSQLEIERRFLADKLKPKLNLEYNLIQKGFPVNQSAMEGSFFTNNYKFGLSFSMPILLRGERGKLQLNNLKATELDFEIQQSGREIINQIQAFYNELANLDEQVKLQEEMVENTEIMRNGEQALFENGESSLFLINSREMALINSRLKLFELQAKYSKVKMMVQWAAGNIEM